MNINMVSSEDVLAGHQDLQELFETPVAPGTPITDIDTLFDEQPKPQDLAAPDASNNPDVCLFNHESGARNPILHVTRANGDLCSEWMDRGSNTQSVPPTRPPQLEPPIIRPRSSNAEHNYAAIKQTPIGTVLAPNAGPTRPLQSAAMINTSSANSRAYFNHSLASRSHYHVREPSNLRNEVHCEQTKYLPLAPMNRNDSGQLAQSMPTSHRLYNTQAQDRMTSMMQHRIHQNFQQSHVRTPLSQDFGLTSLPSDQIGGLQSQYPDLVQYSHQSSTASPYEVFDGNVGVHGNFMALPSPQQTIVFPDTPQMGQRSQFSGLMAAGSRKRQVTISGSSPRIKHEPGNGNLGAITIPQRALQAESNMSQEEEHEYIQALVSAMHDTTATEDNEGMLATWNKIRVKKAEKVQDVCIELLVSPERHSCQYGWY